MVSRGEFLMVLIVIGLATIGCGRAAGAGVAGKTPTARQETKTTPDFGAPPASQVGVHEHADGEAHGHVHLDKAQATAEMRVIPVPSELIVGPNRFAVGLFGAAGGVIHEATVHFHYFDLTDPRVAALESEADAQRLQTPDGYVTIFAHEREFTRAGPWGVEVQARFPDGTVALKRIRFEVLADAPSLAPGEKAPRLHTPTAADVNNDLRQLTSVRVGEPNPAFYELSLDKAIASGKPTLVLFATPAFCQTRFCGPAYQITSELQKKYGEVVNFIHIEVYTGLPDPAVNNWQLAPAMVEFGLRTEPWTFLIDGEGTVVYRVEGLFTTAEIERQLQLALRP